MSRQITVLPQGQIGGITVEATLDEEYIDDLEITDHPVQAFAPISDHSFKRPKRLHMRCGWSEGHALSLLNSPTIALNVALPSSVGTMTTDTYVSNVYSQLLALQEARETLTIVSTLRVYENMLIESLDVRRDSRTAMVLMVEATFREIIRVSLTLTSLPDQANQANPAGTAETQSTGSTAAISAVPGPGGAVPPSMWTP